MEYATYAVFGMACFNHHRAEITVMQFTGHPLLVHLFVTVPWDFNPIPYCQPSSPTPTQYTTSAVFGMACLAGSKVNIQQIYHTTTHGLFVRRKKNYGLFVVSFNLY